MKSIIFIIFLFAFAFRFVDAQTSETISELMPVPSDVGKFSPKKIDSRFFSVDIEFDAKIEFVDLSDGKKGIAVTIQTSYDQLIFAKEGGKPTAKINIYGRITSKNKKTDSFFEEQLTAIVTIEELSDIRGKSITLRKVFVLPEGKYQFGISVRDLYSDYLGIKVMKFQIPQLKTPKK